MLSSCSNDAYKYKFCDYSPTVPKIDMLFMGEYYPMPLPSGIGYPKSEKVDKDGKYILKAYAGKDERYFRQPTFICVALCTETEVLAIRRMDFESYEDGLIKQKDVYKKFIPRYFNILGNVLIWTENLPITINYYAFHYLYKFKKSDFKKVCEFDLTNYFVEDYQGKIYFEYHGYIERSSPCEGCPDYLEVGQGQITIHSWELEYNSIDKTFKLSSYKFNPFDRKGIWSINS